MSLDEFDTFVRSTEERLRDALSATLGSEIGRDAAADALIYAWEHWPKVRNMANPVGYLYVVGRNRGKRAMRAPDVGLMPVSVERTPWIEPGLPDALARLPTQQRISVMLLYCFEWTMSEVADVLGVSKSTVQSHAERGLSRLRDRMGVPS